MYLMLPALAVDHGIDVQISFAISTNPVLPARVSRKFFWFHASGPPLVPGSPAVIVKHHHSGERRHSPPKKDRRKPKHDHISHGSSSLRAGNVPQRCTATNGQIWS